ncbi:MAG TPA: MarR family transcriptional regulator [Bacteroidetes bacterium]|jgi:DNA-binding MarR family transcriptional regulator|nr:MarR family transcriptional regulator [Arcobacter sp.]HHH54027.1 MarR family transcriptional regulator [Bacteroidota bacterium]
MDKKSNFKISKQESSGFLLWQVTTLWQREIKSALENINLSHSGFVILASLIWFKEQNQEVTQTTIIEHSKLDKMTVSKSLKTLEKNYLILRTENEKDTRAKTITLTDKGLNLAVKSIEIVEDIDIHFFAKLNIEEKENLNKIFNTLKES